MITADESAKEDADAEYGESVLNSAYEVASAIPSDIEYQFNKFGPQRLTDGEWLKVIVEEEGEALKEINSSNWELAKAELLQVIACWTRLYNEVVRMERGLHITEKEWYSRAT